MKDDDFNGQMDNLHKTDNSESKANKDVDSKHQTKKQSDEKTDLQISKNNDRASQESVLKQQSESEKMETSRDINTEENNDDIPTKVEYHEEGYERDQQKAGYRIQES